MSFKELSEAFFSGSSPNRETATIEYKSNFGHTIGTRAHSLDTIFTARGNGQLEYFRRGDFMERGDAFPGVWKAKCDPKDLETAWDKLGELVRESFPARVADPGDPTTSITGFYPDRVETLTWGPPDPTRDAPGDDFLIALAPFMNIAAEGEAEWAVEMSFSSIEISDSGVFVKLEFKNHGRLPIGIVLPNPESQGGFALRYSLDREVPEGVTRLPVEWTWCKLDIPNRHSERLWNLTPGIPFSISLKADLDLESNRKYIGKIQYEQIRHLDTFAGYAILSGSCYSAGFEFQT